jgi:DNA replication and repair protein RecF
VQLRSLTVQHFRNLAQQIVSLGEGLNVLVGENGQGKTNLVEAIHFLSTLRSFRTTSARDLLAHGQERGLVQGEVDSEGVSTRLKVILDRKGRYLWIGERSVRGIQEYLEILKVISFAPDDLNMIKGLPLLRRRFLDRAAFQFEAGYLRSLRDFSLALRSRNRLLKSNQVDVSQIESFSGTLSRCGSALTSQRAKLLKRLEATVHKSFGWMDAGQVGIELRFKPGWAAGDQMNPQLLAEELAKSLPQDQRFQTTRIGPQRDDFEILIDDRPARRFASQGQQRALTIALLLSLLEQITVEIGQRPILLLDDISSELDAAHRQRLFERIRQQGGQVLVTTTDQGLLDLLAGSSMQVWRVEAGRVSSW